MTPTELAHAVTSADVVRQWRLDELSKAGYQPSDALVLSGRREIDLHVAISLLKRGCPPQTALRILI